MHDAMARPEHGCHPADSNCGTWLAVPFFVSYTILSSMVVLKMLIALIIENYKLSKREDQRLVKTAHRDAFVDAWAMIDPEGLGHIAVAQLHHLIRSLQAPLGLDPREFHKGAIKERDVSHFIMTLDLVAYESRRGSGKVVLFHDVLLALTTRALDAQAKADHNATPLPKGGDDGPSCSMPSPSGTRVSPAWTKVGGSKEGLVRVVAGARAKAGIGSSSEDATSACDQSTQGSAAAAISGEDGHGSVRPRRGGGGGECRGGGTSMSPETAVDAVAMQQHSIAHENDLHNLRAIFGLRVQQSMVVEETKNDLVEARESVRGLAQTLIFSLSAEYAATVLQRVWRERKRKRHARIQLKRAQSAPAHVQLQ